MKPMRMVQLGKPSISWWDEEYLFWMFLHKWIDLDIDSEQMAAILKSIVFNIMRSKRYSVVSGYFYYIMRQVNYNANVEIGVSDDETGEFKSYGTQPAEKMWRACQIILALICIEKGKLLVGTKTNQPLWIDTPHAWYEEGPHPRRYDFQVSYTFTLLMMMPLMSGESRQQAYDRLMFPAPERWPRAWQEWTLDKALKFEEVVGEHLGFDNGVVSEDEYVQIISQAFLDQKYSLVEDMPVLVRLQEHPLIHQLILMRKGDKLLCKIGTFDHGDFLHMQYLSEVFRVDYFKQLIDILISESNLTQYENTNWAITALVASIYRDLVTVEEKDIGTRRYSSKKKPDIKPVKNPEDEEPKLFTTAWQYIPRRQYIYNRPNDDSLMDREPLTELEQHKQRAIRKWHMVCGHVRRFRDRPDFMADGDRQDIAISDGIILRQGETYVRPHARNASALEELGEIDINTIPHYLRRKVSQ